MILYPELVLAKLVFSLIEDVDFFFFLATLYSLWDLSSRTRDWAQATAVKAQNPNH